MPDTPPSIAAPAPAATLILVRDVPAFQVLMVERHPGNAFGPGALVFPGGKLHDEDHEAAWGEAALGWSALDPESRALRICAVRETYEETAVLLARAQTGPSLPDQGGEWRIGPQAASARDRVCAGETRFLDLVQELDLTLDLHALTPFSRWVTPEDRPIRFDASFFIATAPSDQLASSDGYETVSAEWIEPERALALARAGDRKLMFPTRMTLQQIGESRCAEEAITRAQATPAATIRPGPGARG